MRWLFGSKKETTEAPVTPADSGASDWDFLRSRPDFDEEEMATARGDSPPPAPAPAASAPHAPHPAAARRREPQTAEVEETAPQETVPESGNVRRLKLEVVSGRRRFNWIIRDEAVVGRRDFSEGSHPEIDLFADLGVALRHARIAKENGRYLLYDLGSEGGTRKNGNPVLPEAPQDLRVGDRIDLGEQSMMRVLEAPGVTTLTVEDVILGEMLQGAIGSDAVG